MFRSRRALPAFLLFALLAVPPVLSAEATGNKCCPQDFVAPARWPAEAPPDPRAELLFPVNVVRIWSDEHAAAGIAPDRWILAQIDIANRLFRYSDAEMAAYGAGRPAPVIQFRLNRVYDVHEKEVSETLGYPMDTESVYGAIPDGNGVVRVGTRDLRTLKVTDEVDHLTVFCVHAIKNPVDDVSEFGGESNVGFADRAPTGPRRTLTRVSDVRARLGVVTTRQEGAWMNNFAHEIGHFFGLPHAWEHDWNGRLGIADLGNGPQGNADGQAGLANVMDYENGPGVVQYFSRAQLDFMARFAREKASTWVKVIRSTGGAPPPPVVTAGVRIDRVTVPPPAPGGAVAVRVAFTATGLAGRPLNVIAWFYDGTGQEMKDLDGQYKTVGGQVSVGGEATPGRENQAFADFVLDLPAGQMHLPPGRHAVNVVVGIFAGGEQLATADAVPMTYEVPGVPVSGPDVPPVTGGPAAAWIVESRVEPAAEHEGQRWVRVIANLQVNGLKGSKVLLQARYSFTDGTPLRDFDGTWVSAEGLAFAENGIVIEYDQSTVTGMEVWIPLAQLHLAEGAFDVVAGLTLVEGGRVLASATTAPFRVGQGTAMRVVAPAAEIREVWVTHNHPVGNGWGMAIHVRVVVSGLRGQAVNLVAWFFGGDGTRLNDFDGAYRTQDGQVSAALTLTPLYDVAEFPECIVVVPYDQLHLAPGRHLLGLTLGVFSGATQVGAKNDMTTFEVLQR
ncbi:MAG: hypothetical protein MUE73_02540 [Planctomycetes bacterium]|nr:hypothetical protein [Planctomycetota bacterium]